MNRLAVYVFWEKDGMVRDYVVTYLKGLTTIANKLYVVVNGEIQSDGKHRIEKETKARVLQRPNEGVDFWAYKEALDTEGKEIVNYDEVVLCNCSCYGPIYPFSEMFAAMGKRDVDFWGITEWPLNEAGYQGTWVLSYFMVFRPNMFLSAEWSEYWKNLCPVHSRDECIALHETKFTQHFADKGFTYDVYCPNSADYIDPTIEAPDKLVIEQRCPVILQNSKDNPEKASIWISIIAVAALLSIPQLAKFSYIAMAAALLIITTVILLVYKRYVEIALLLGGYIASTCLLWVFSGEQLQYLPSYVHAMLQFVSGYSEVMSMPFSVHDEVFRDFIFCTCCMYWLWHHVFISTNT